MIRLYFAAAFVAAIFFAYITGVHVGNIKCGTRIANANAERMILDNEIIRKTNETVFHTGVRDVRRILHDKYTIAE